MNLGKTKFAIENATKTRVVLADQTIHVLGGFRNIHLATEAICKSYMGQFAKSWALRLKAFELTDLQNRQLDSRESTGESLL